MVLRGRLEEDEIDQLAHAERSSLSGVWLYKAKHCPDTNQGQHNWIPISWKLSEKTKQVSTIMCTQCFHEINIAEAFEHRIKP